MVEGNLAFSQWILGRIGAVGSECALWRGRRPMRMVVATDAVSSWLEGVPSLESHKGIIRKTALLAKLYRLASRPMPAAARDRKRREVERPMNEVWRTCVARRAASCEALLAAERARWQGR